MVLENVKIATIKEDKAVLIATIKVQLDIFAFTSSLRVRRSLVWKECTGKYFTNSEDVYLACRRRSSMVNSAIYDMMYPLIPPSS